MNRVCFLFGFIGFPVYIYAHIPVNAKFAPVIGKPAIVINGAPVLPMIYSLAYLPGVVDDIEAEVVGTVNRTGESGFARKNFKDPGMWHISLRPDEVPQLRIIFQRTGAHIYYSEDGDVMHVGNGILSIHTASGGSRSIISRNDMAVQLTLKPASTTCLTARPEKTINNTSI